MIINDIFDKGPFEFYGVYNNKFKLGETVFEALEDPDDGYRSYLSSIELINYKGIFSKRPFALVKVQEYEDGIRLIDDNTGHVWLKIYTDNSDDYYPLFKFEYALPKIPLTEFIPKNLCPKDQYPEYFI
jgi:hypothetical protein